MTPSTNNNDLSGGVLDRSGRLSSAVWSVLDSIEDDFIAQDGNQDEAISRGGVATPFPWKLHEMLLDAERDGNQWIVSWRPHGRSFTVHKPKEFVSKIMPSYFNQTKYASFQRQLNLYGFCRFTQGRDKGAYFHKCFVRGKRSLCRGMIRQKIKGTKVRRTIAPEEEPNFYDTNIYSPSPHESDSHKKTEADSDVGGGGSLSPANAAALKDILLSQSAPGRGLPRLVSPDTTISPPCKDVVSPTTNSSDDETIKCGDVLFFEGRPFHYLDGTEEVAQSTPAKEILPDTRSETKPASKPFTLQNRPDTLASFLSIDPAIMLAGFRSQEFNPSNALENILKKTNML